MASEKSLNWEHCVIKWGTDGALEERYAAYGARKKPTSGINS
jgi:hypothetical protein